MNTMEVGFLQCPYCDYKAQSLGAKEDLAVCDKCRKVFPKEQIKIIVEKHPYVTCSDCNIDVSLTEGNRDFGTGSKYICPKCLKVVAVKRKGS